MRLAFLSADAIPFLRNHAVASSTLLLFCASAFLQSIIPQPVESRSCFTVAAEMPPAAAAAGFFSSTGAAAATAAGAAGAGAACRFKVGE